MNVWRTSHAYRFCLILCLSFLGCLEGRMRYTSTLPVEKDTSSNGSVIGRHVRRRFSFGKYHRKTRARAILLRGMSSEDACIGGSLSGYVIGRRVHRRFSCWICIDNYAKQWIPITTH